MQGGYLAAHSFESRLFLAAQCSELVLTLGPQPTQIRFDIGDVGLDVCDVGLDSRETRLRGSRHIEHRSGQAASRADSYCVSCLLVNIVL